MADFSISLAWTLLGHCRTAYESPTINAPLAHAYVADAGEYNVLAYRGTADLRDWLTDACAILSEWQGESFHAGFVRAYRESLASIQDAAAGLDHTKPLHVTGHSLGGALAVLYAADHDDTVASCYTFGQPRLGSYGAAEFIEYRIGDKLWRVRDSLDIVTHLPLPPLYRHRRAGRLALLNGMGGMDIAPGLVARLRVDLGGWWRALRHDWEEPLTDHFLDSYQTRLQSLLPDLPGNHPA